MRKSQKGNSVPLLLILAILVLVLPVYYWVNSNSFNFSPSQNIRGASYVGSPSASPGFSVSISAISDTWDLVEYLCVDMDECLQSLNSGRRLGTVSGGQTDLHEVVVKYNNNWKDYAFLKFFVRSGWYAPQRKFKVLSPGSVPSTRLHTFNEAGIDYDVVIVPVRELVSTFYSSASFSDN